MKEEDEAKLRRSGEMQSQNLSFGQQIQNQYYFLKIENNKRTNKEWFQNQLEEIVLKQLMNPLTLEKKLRWKWF